MNVRPERSTESASAESQLKGFIDKFERRHQTLIHAARKAMRRRLPTAFELAYDNYNFFVPGYGPTARPSNCVVSLAGASGLKPVLPPGREAAGSEEGTAGRRQPNSLRSAFVGGRYGASGGRGALVGGDCPGKTPFHRARRAGSIIRSVSTKQRPRRRDA